jgi:ubiquitin carboxyl-terminal hydrolase 7
VLPVSRSIPFRFLLKEGEKFADTKKRLEKRIGLKGKSFEKIKFAVVRRSHFSRPQYLTDGEFFSLASFCILHDDANLLFSADDILWDVTQEDDCLGLDHPDRTRSLRNGAGDLFLKG